METMNRVNEPTLTLRPGGRGRDRGVKSGPRQSDPVLGGLPTVSRGLGDETPSFVGDLRLNGISTKSTCVGKEVSGVPTYASNFQNPGRGVRRFVPSVWESS